MKSKAGKTFSIILAVVVFCGVIVSLLYSHFSTSIRTPDNIIFDYSDYSEDEDSLEYDDSDVEEDFDKMFEENEKRRIELLKSVDDTGSVYEENNDGSMDETFGNSTSVGSSDSESVSDENDHGEGVASEDAEENPNYDYSLSNSTYCSYCYYCVIGFAILDDTVKDAVTTDFQLGYNAMMAEEPFKTLNGKRSYQSYDGNIETGSFSVTFDDIGTYNFHVELVDDKIDKITFLDNTEVTQDGSSDGDTSEDSEEN